MHALLPVLRPGWRREEHLFCLAYKDRPFANHDRLGWLYRNLPSNPSDLELSDKETSPQMTAKKLRISMINLNLVAEDAIGTCIINQARLFRRRGDDVRIHILHAPVGVPTDVEALASVVSLRDLISGQNEHFNSSDLYIFHYPSRHELMESIRGIDRGTVIFYYHNVTPPELWGSETDRDLLVQGIEGKVLAHYADLCITDSPYNKQDLVDSVGCDPDRIYVVPFAVTLDSFTPGEKDPALVERYGLAGAKVLLFVGRMAGNKRIDLVIEALAQIQEHVPNTKLLLVGDKDSAPAYREIVAAAQLQASELGIADSIIWTGTVRRSELPAYFRLADAYVSASLHEGFGVPLIEAMACGIPVVAGRAGAIPWVLGDAGLLGEPNDSSSLAKKALSIIEDADLHQTFVQLGLERAQAFSLEQHEQEVVRIIDQAITYSLPAAISEPGTGQGPETMRRPSISRARDEIVLGVMANELAVQSDIAMRDYHVRSRLPLVGPMIAWIRRNLTSHLREPYLDPMIERQVDLNYRIAEVLRRVASALESASRQREELEARVEVLEAQLNALTEQSHPDESQGESAT